MDISLKTEKKENLILESKHVWLNDTIMDAAQTLLKELTKGQISGWQTTLYCQRLTMFETIPHGFPFVQIMHVSNSHWITVSNVNTNKKNPPFSDAVIGGGICLKVGGGTRKIITEMHVQMRAGMIVTIVSAVQCF